MNAIFLFMWISGVCIAFFSYAKRKKLKTRLSEKNIDMHIWEKYTMQCDLMLILNIISWFDVIMISIFVLFLP